MEKKDYELKILTDNQNEINLINDYWKNKNGEFLNTNAKLGEKYSLKTHELTKIVKEKSILTRKDNCFRCKDSFDRIVETKGKWNPSSQCIQNGKWVYFSICEPCKKIQVEENRKIDEQRRIEQEELIKKERELEFERKQLLLAHQKEQKSNINIELYRAIEQQKWRELSEVEFNVLKQIIFYNNRSAIFSNVFKPDYQGTWSIVNMLEKMNLLSVIRDYDDGVVEFYFLEELAQILNGFNQGELNEVVRNNLGFSLSQKINRKNLTDPNYSGVFNLPHNVVLEKGIDYVYGAWIQTDGSINLKITPKTEVFPSAEYKDIEKEPQSIKEHINSMFNKIEPFDNFLNEEDDYF